MSLKERYLAYRNLNKAFHKIIIHEYLKREDIMRAADILSMLKNNSIILNEKSDLDFVMDFAIYEKGQGPHERLQEFSDGYLPKNDIEKSLIYAMNQAESSLFEVIKVDQDRCLVFLSDLLNEGKAFTIVDVGLSQTIKPGLLLFCRLIAFEDLHITSGFGFMFEPDNKAFYLRKYKKSLKQLPVQMPSIKRFVTFKHLYQTDGLPIRFEHAK